MGPFVTDGEAATEPDVVGEDATDVDGAVDPEEDFLDTVSSCSVIVDGGNVSRISVTV